MQSANQPTDKPRTEIDPGNQVATLSSCESLYALRWLATIGPDSPYGQALMRSLNAVRQHRGESVPPLPRTPASLGGRATPTQPGAILCARRYQASSENSYPRDSEPFSS
jgi:hypothetical protein